MHFKNILLVILMQVILGSCLDKLCTSVRQRSYLVFILIQYLV